MILPLRTLKEIKVKLARIKLDSKLGGCRVKSTVDMATLDLYSTFIFYEIFSIPCEMFYEL